MYAGLQPALTLLLAMLMYFLGLSRGAFGCVMRQGDTLMEGVELWLPKTLSFSPFRDKFRPTRLNGSFLLYMLGFSEAHASCWTPLSMINVSSFKYCLVSIVILLIL